MEEKKRKRMESNRESARRSRQRKQRHLDDLVRQVAQLQNQKGEISGKMTEISRHFGVVEAANTVLSAEKERLARRLESLESVIEIARVLEASSNGGNSYEFGGSGFSDGGSCEFGMVNPWRQMMTMIPDSGASVSVMAASSSGMFEF